MLVPIDSAYVTSYYSVIVTLVLSCTVSDHIKRILQLLCAPPTPSLFHPNFGGVPVAPDRPCWSQPEQRGLKLFGGEIIFEEFQPVWKHTSTSQADRQTDDMQSHNRALRSIVR